MPPSRSQSIISLIKTTLFAAVAGACLMTLLYADTPGAGSFTAGSAALSAFSTNTASAVVVRPAGLGGTGIPTGMHQAVWDLAAINSEMPAGSLAIAGMLPEDYDNAMAIEWSWLNRRGTPQPLEVDLHKPIGYAEIESILFNLDLYEGVDVLDIGDSAQGRNIYMVTIDLQAEDMPASDKPVILLTGSVHAREFAGADYLVKMMNDLMIKAESDTYTRRLLAQVTIVCVPLVNPDGRELIMNGGDADRKSNANGVDLNRNMPSLNAGMLLEGMQSSADIDEMPSLDFFPGYRLGSESESRAMIRFFNTYVPDARTRLYVDLHQRGQFMYYNKPFLTYHSDERSQAFAAAVSALLNDGYPPQREAYRYGLNGQGGTMTDYARSVAEGMVYSYKYGRLVLMMDGVETPLVRFRDLDNAIKAYRPANPAFIAITPEIGTEFSIGPDEQARQLRAQTYDEFGWADFLPGIIQMVLGEAGVNGLKAAG